MTNELIARRFKRETGSADSETPGVIEHPGVLVIQIQDKPEFLGSCQCRFGTLGELCKSLGIFDGDFRKDPAVQGNACLLQAAYKSAIRNIVVSGGSTQSDDEEAAESAFLCPPVPIRESESAIHGLLCGPMQFTFR